MNQYVTKGIVLTRTNFGEADRIITVLTKDSGKQRLMAKGVRKPKSKLAGGIELFSVSDITFRRGRGDIGTLVSARLSEHFGKIVKDIDRTMLGYDLIKQINKATEDAPGEKYFNLLLNGLGALNDYTINPQLVRAWFNAQLLLFDGYSPDLYLDVDGKKLDGSKKYEFDFEKAKFKIAENGSFDANNIKFLRLLFSNNSINILQKVDGLDGFLAETGHLIQLLFTQYIRQ